MCGKKKYYGEDGATTSFLRLRLSVGVLQKYFSLLAATSAVPYDVKEGHFAVLAVKGAAKKRFVVEVECLNSPAFLRLLEQAEEEYGSERTGALVVPCKPEELHKILKIEL